MFICAKWINIWNAHDRLLVARCDKPDGHDGRHEDSVISIGWEDDDARQNGEEGSFSKPEIRLDLFGRDAALPSAKQRPKPPVHAFEVRISIGGDDWGYVLRAIEELASHIPDHGPECGMCSGGGGGCHSVDIKRRDVTPEQYHRELEEWRLQL